MKRYGTGCSGSRLLNGTYEIHIELEKKLADFVNKESALLFSTGFQTNQGCIVPLIGRRNYILTDRENHSSIFQGIIIVKGLFDKDRIIKYRHNDMVHLERLLANLPKSSGKLIISDGVFSMLGDLDNLPVMVELAKKYGARILIDDAHGPGVLGIGKGTPHFFGLHQQTDIIMGTFSKSFASLGGFIASNTEVIDFIKHHSPAHIFSASMAPPQVAAVMKALEILREEPERIERLNYIQKRVRSGLQEIGYIIPDGIVPIVPIIIGDDLKTFQFWQQLFENGIFVNAVISPAVPRGSQMLRLSFMSEHNDDHINYLLDVFENLGTKHGYIENKIAYEHRCAAI